MPMPKNPLKKKKRGEKVEKPVTAPRNPKKKDVLSNPFANRNTRKLMKQVDF